MAIKASFNSTPVKDVRQVPPPIWASLSILAKSHPTPNPIVYTWISPIVPIACISVSPSCQPPSDMNMRRGLKGGRKTSDLCKTSAEVRRARYKSLPPPFIFKRMFRACFTLIPSQIIRHDSSCWMTVTKSPSLDDRRSLKNECTTDTKSSHGSLNMDPKSSNTRIAWYRPLAEEPRWEQPYVWPSIDTWPGPLWEVRSAEMCHTGWVQREGEPLALRRLGWPHNTPQRANSFKVNVNVDIKTMFIKKTC